MVKVLNVISDTNIGGAGRVLINYLKYFDREKYDVSVVMPANSLLKPRVEALGVRVWEVDAMEDKSFDRAAIKKLLRVIRDADPDIVHTHGSFSGRVAGRRAGKKVVYTRHSAFPPSRRMTSFPIKQLNGLINARYADRIIAISPAAAKNLTDTGVPERLIDVMMNGVEPVKRADAAAFKAKYGITDEFVLGILARIEDYKGHLDILEAVRLLKERGKKIRLLVAGAGAFEPEVRKRTSELGLSGEVVFTGFISDVSEALSAMDVQLNASWGTETSCLSVLEGFSMGLPSVVSDYGGNPWLVEDGVDGLMFKTRDFTAMADCIQRVMDDPGLFESLKKGALNSYNTKFTGAIMARNIEKTYEKVMKGIR